MKPLTPTELRSSCEACRILTFRGNEGIEAGIRLVDRGVPLAVMLSVMMDGTSRIHNVILVKVRGYVSLEAGSP